MQTLSFVDLVLTPIYLFILYVVARLIQIRRIEKYPEYKYFLSALSAKMAGAIGLCLVYTLYYNGGDTTQYFSDAIMVNKLFFKNPAHGLDVIINGLNAEKLRYFDPEIGYPAYWRGTSTSLVVQFVTVFSFFGLRGYIPTSVILAWISFLGIWNLYRVFLSEFPKLSREMAIAIFFIPSVLFWGSGILKDTFTLSALGYYVYAFYFGVIKHKNVFRNLIVIVISLSLIVIIKPYIFIAVVPGSVIWFTNNLLRQIGGKVLRLALAPVFLIMFAVGAYMVVYYMGGSLGNFSADQLVDRAIVTQRDLKSDYYRGNSFDIGEFDNSFGSILRVMPAAMIAGLFRPFILEARNVMMVVSALENLFFLVIFLKVLYQVKVIGFFRFFVRNDLLTFSLVFSFFFAFAIGLSTSNFGSLVRYKIPAIPFFVASMYLIRHMITEEKTEKARLEAQLQESSVYLGKFAR